MCPVVCANIMESWLAGQNPLVPFVRGVWQKPMALMETGVKPNLWRPKLKRLAVESGFRWNRFKPYCTVAAKELVSRTVAPLISAACK
jgi:hypothetical protein